MFKQPLHFVDEYDEAVLGTRKHTVLFHEEPEYATIISFRYIKSGLDQNKRCSYISHENPETVKAEMAHNEIEVQKFTNNDMLYIHQFPKLRNFQARTAITSLFDRAPKANKLGSARERLVLRCIHEIKSKKDIRDNLRIEGKHNGYFRDFPKSMLVTYYVEDIISTVTGENGLYSKWMNVLIENYDAVIFARKGWQGVGLNLS